jgi:hypothetical protein
MVADAVLNLARAIFSNGGRLVMADHPSITPFVAKVSAEYEHIRRNTDRPPNSPRVILFRSREFALANPRPTPDWERCGIAHISTPKRFDRTASLQVMREWMLGNFSPEDEGTVEAGERRVLETMRPPRAMIVVGGTLRCFEDVAAFLRIRRERSWIPVPQVFVFTTTGGAAARLTDQNFDYHQTIDAALQLSPADTAELIAARHRGELHPVEAEWHRGHPCYGCEDASLARALPFARIANSLLERVLSSP